MSNPYLKRLAQHLLYTLVHVVDPRNSLQFLHSLKLNSSSEVWHVNLMYCLRMQAKIAELLRILSTLNWKFFIN